MQSNWGVDPYGARFESTAVVFTFFHPMRELNVRNDPKTFHSKHVCTHRGASLALGAVELHQTVLKHELVQVAVLERRLRSVCFQYLLVR